MSIPSRLSTQYGRAQQLSADQSGLAGKDQVFLHQLVLALDTGLVEGDAVHRADLLALRLVVVADAFGAQVGVDHVDLFALGNRGVGALGLADVAVDAVVGDLQGHGTTPAVAMATTLFSNRW